MKMTAWLLFLLLILVLFENGCGGDDDDDDDSDPADQDDDDNGNPDDDDDDDASDDDDNDDSSDDDDNDDDSTEEIEYGPVRCALPDPEGLGEGITVGGGGIDDSIRVYVYNDLDCQAIEGALVNGLATDSDGYALVPATKSGQTVIAVAEGHWSWAYQADAAVMYFRLKKNEEDILYGDTEPGQFLLNGSPVDYTNPNGTWNILDLGDFLQQPIVAGIALPGISRSGFFSTDIDGLMPNSNFSLFLHLNEMNISADAPKSIYVPAMDFELTLAGLLTAGGYGGNETFKLPYLPGSQEIPMEALCLSLTLGNAFSAETILALIPVLMGGGDLTELLIPLLKPIVNDVLAMEFHGANPDYDQTGAPWIDVADIQSGDHSIQVQIADPAEESEYLGILAGEIPNRGLWPVGIKMMDQGTMTFPASHVTDSDYIMAVGRIQVPEDSKESPSALTVNFALKYAESLEDWSEGITLDDETDFYHSFDQVTEYSAEGVLSWQLEGGAKPDLYLIAALPEHDETIKTGLAVLSGWETTFDCAGHFGYAPEPTEDIILLAAIDLPDDVDPNQFDPTSLLGYNSPSVALWTNLDVMALLEDLLSK